MSRENIISLLHKLDYKRKPQARDRKATLTLRPFHLDLQHVIDALSRNEFPNNAIAQVIDDIDNEINICDEICNNMDTQLQITFLSII